jgi:hypothetical protein
MPAPERRLTAVGPWFRTHALTPLFGIHSRLGDSFARVGNTMARPKTKCGICGHRAKTAAGLKTHITRVHDSGQYVRDLQAEVQGLRAESKALSDRLSAIRRIAR